MTRLLPVVLILLVAITPATALLATAQAPVEIVLATPAWKTLNPLTFVTVYGEIVIDKIYEPLVRLGPDGVTVVPNLAESWSIKTEAGKKIVIFKLRKGVVWHDGEPVTADDVVYTIKLVMSNPKAFVAPSKYVYEGLESVEKVDDYTVKLVYDASKAAADSFLLQAFTSLYIVPKHVWEKLPDKTASLTDPKLLVGCGPFKVVEVKPGEYVKMVAFEKHFRGKPGVDKLMIKVVENRNTFAMMVATGQVDGGYFYFFGKLLEALEKTVKGNPNIRIYRCPSTSTHMLVLNINKPVFKNVKFRKAILYAINVDAIVKKYYGEKGAIPGTMGFLGPRFGIYSYYVPKEQVYPYNPELAKKILDELGYRDIDGDGYRETPDGKKLELVLITRAPGDAFFRDAIADEIANYLKKVGIKVRVEKLASKVYWARWKKKEFDMAIVGYVPKYPIALSWFTTGDPGNVLGYSNPVYDALVSRFIRTGDPKLAWEAEKILIREAFLVGLYHPIVATPYRIDKYKDWVASPVGYTAGYWSVLGSKIVFNKPGPVEVSAEMLIEKCRRPTPSELVDLNPDLAPKTPTPTATPAKTPAATATVTKTVTVSTTVTKTVTTTVTAGPGMGLAAGLLVVGLVVGLAVGYLVARRKS